MKYILITLSVIVILLSSCKKELQPAPGTKTIDTQSMNYNPPPPPGTCAGNTWNYDHTFYPDWNDPPQFPSDMQPIVYNDKVYVPDYSEQEVRIFDGNSWEHLPSIIPIYTDYRGISFTIGNKAYIGNSQGFYQYSFTTNSWLRKADCPYSKRYGAAAFSIGTKGYVAAGVLDYANIRYKDMWEYNPATDTWTRKTDLPVTLDGMAFFVVNNKAYTVCGRTGSEVPYTKIDALYEYDPAINIWISKAAFPGGARAGMVAFVINGKAYCGGGYVSAGEKDYYRYNQTTNTWTRVADMSLDFMKSSKYGFSINSSGYAVYNHTVSDNLYTVKYSPLICTLPLQ